MREIKNRIQISNIYSLQMEEVPLRRQYMVKCPTTIPESGCHGKSEVYHNLGKLGKLFFKEVRLKFDLAGLYNVHQMFG